MKLKGDKTAHRKAALTVFGTIFCLYVFFFMMVNFKDFTKIIFYIGVICALLAGAYYVIYKFFED